MRVLIFNWRNSTMEEKDIPPSSIVKDKTMTNPMSLGIETAQYGYVYSIDTLDLSVDIDKVFPLHIWPESCRESIRQLRYKRYAGVMPPNSIDVISSL